MAGTQSVSADDRRLLGIPRSRQTVAIIYPQYDTNLQGFPATSGQGSTGERWTPSPSQCSARAAQDIWEHHRPAVGSSMRALGSVHSTSEKLGTRGSRVWTPCGATPRARSRTPDRPARPHPRAHPRDRTLPNASPRLVGGRYLTRYRNQPDKSLHQSGAAMHHRPQDLERALSLSIPAAS
jgi:hypothetical protein